ncbi:MAG TPA: phage tail tip lysozyme [Kofleriaceae bacterium]
MKRLCLLLAVVGCVDQVDPTETSDTEQAATTAFANDKPAFDFFVGKGLTPFQAAGIVGNLDQESGVNPNSVQSGGPGRGIAQWSVGGRWDSSNPNVTSYATSQNMSRLSLNLQLEFIWYEFTHVGYGFDALKATTNVTDATVTFMAKYEICGNCIQTQRVSYAKAVLAAYGQIPYGGTYVSQSWPLASEPALQIKCGESVNAKIVLKNNGTKTWNTMTRLGTTQPRDRTSIFSGADWVAGNRAAAIDGTVAPGANGTFTFKWDAPTGAACVPGTYKEYFGLVQEGAGWFSDAGNAGPADDVIEALIELLPADATTGSDGGSDQGSDFSGSDGSDDGTQPGGQSAGCNAGGQGAASFAGVLLLGLLRRQRRLRA